MHAHTRLLCRAVQWEESRFDKSLLLKGNDAQVCGSSSLLFHFFCCLSWLTWIGRCAMALPMRDGHCTFCHSAHCRFDSNQVSFQMFAFRVLSWLSVSHTTNVMRSAKLPNYRYGGGGRQSIADASSQ